MQYKLHNEDILVAIKCHLSRVLIDYQEGKALSWQITQQEKYTVVQYWSFLKALCGRLQIINGMCQILIVATASNGVQLGSSIGALTEVTRTSNQETLGYIERQGIWIIGHCNFSQED
jgi:hypothetical protein